MKLSSATHVPAHPPTIIYIARTFVSSYNMCRARGVSQEICQGTSLALSVHPMVFQKLQGEPDEEIYDLLF